MRTVLIVKCMLHSFRHDVVLLKHRKWVRVCGKDAVFWMSSCCVVRCCCCVCSSQWLARDTPIQSPSFDLRGRTARKVTAYRALCVMMSPDDGTYVVRKRKHAQVLPSTTFRLWSRFPSNSTEILASPTLKSYVIHMCITSLLSCHYMYMSCHAD